MERTDLSKRTAATYKLPDPWGRVEEYQKVMDEHASTGDKSTAISRKFELNRNRIRQWIDNGSKPDVVHALDVAEAHGWFDVDDQRVLRNLVICAAWISSGGSIAEQSYAPVFIASTDDERERLTHALDALNVSYRIEDRSDESRGVAVVPTDGASPFGRVLAACGAPVGEKNVPGIELPWILDEVGRGHRLAYCATVVRNRAGERFQAGEFVNIREERPAHYLDALAEEIEEVTGGSVARSEANLRLDPDAVEELRQVPLR